MIDIKVFVMLIMGFFWGGLTAPVSIKLASIFGILDIPDARKIHTQNTPRGAGLGLWVGYMLMALFFAAEIPMMKFIATGATIIFLCGYLDDMCSLSPFPRLILHLCASALIVVPLELNPVLTVFGVVWLAGVTSAYNLIDGMNGLCISIFMASSAALFFLGRSYPGVYMGAMALGVLCWNFPAAWTFLGDGGSTLLGYLFASHFIIIALPAIKNVAIHEIVLVLLLFGGVPVLDTMIAFSRRILAGNSPFYPDKKHLHHILLNLTGSNILTVIILVTLQGLTLMAGLSVFSRLISRG